MDKSVIDKYIEEMKRMSARANPTLKSEPVAASPVIPAVAETVNENLTGEGYLSVNVTSVRGLYPIKNAKVTVFTGRAENMQKLFEGYTDESGKTEVFPLPAPPLSLAQRPESTLPVYAEYNILAEADGFIPAINYSLAIFDGVTSLQNMNLIPKTVFSDNSPIITDEENKYEL